MKEEILRMCMFVYIFLKKKNSLLSLQYKTMVKSNLWSQGPKIEFEKYTKRDRMGRGNKNSGM